MKKQILILSIMALCSVMLVSGVFAQMYSGNANLNWNNYQGRPQNFSGSITGDLSGDISIISNSDYDGTSVSVGFTDGIVQATINNVNCNGYYSGGNYNSGCDKGVFTLGCEDGTMYTGSLNGCATQDSNGDWKIMDLKYNAFNFNQKGIKGDIGLQGEQGLKGDTGSQGDQGIQGTPGTNGIDGKDGINGVNGAIGPQGIPGNDGTNGIDGLPGKDGTNGQDGAIGQQGLKGDKGDQGIQGIQGLTGSQGPKGDTGAVGPQGSTGATGTCTCDLTRVNKVLTGVFTYFPDFASWYNSTDKCTNGQLQCSGNNAQKCISNNWITQSSCQYGCTSGVCNNPPFVCTAGTKQCSGSIPQTCVNNAWVNGVACQYGCTSGNCNSPPVTKEDCTKKLYCSSGYSVTTTATCTTGHGTSTSCDIGFCKQGSGWNVPYTYCSKGCDSTTGKCK